VTHFVSRLDFLYVVQVGRVEHLRAINRQDQFSLGPDDSLIPGGFSPFQFGPASRNLPAPLPVARLPM